MMTGFFRPTLRNAAQRMARSGTSTGTSTSSYWMTTSCAMSATTTIGNHGVFVPQQQRPTYTLMSQTRTFAEQPSKLMKLLKREIAEEMENKSTEMPEALAELKAKIEKNWKVIDDDAFTRLHKMAGPLKIQISFHCQDTVDRDYNDFADYDEDEDFDEEEEDEEDHKKNKKKLKGGDDDDDDDDDDEEEREPQDSVKCLVIANKAGKSLVFTCVVGAGEKNLDIQTMALTSEEPKDILLNSGVSEASYQGPEFGELNEELQESIRNYVEETAGLNEDLQAFILMYMDYKEQTQYVKFLKDMNIHLSS